LLFISSRFFFFADFMSYIISVLDTINTNIALRYLYIKNNST